MSHGPATPATATARPVASRTDEVATQHHTTDASMATAIYRLTPRVMHYAWGSHQQIAELTGRPTPSARPEAELWMGAHEQAPSRLTCDGSRTTLDVVIGADPIGMLGPSCATQFGGRLPFLLKILAPDKPLSIQCHPSQRQVLDAPPGTYPDLWPKPEGLLALTPFEAFAAARPFSQVHDTADRLRAREFSACVTHAGRQTHPLRALLNVLLHLPDDRRIPLVRGLVRACQQRAAAAPPGVSRVVTAAARLFPDDIGLAVLLLMRHHTLQPGAYLPVPSGVLHAYVGGTGVEILANCDNVARAGLTPKPINTRELLRIVDVDKTTRPATPSVNGRVHTYPAGTPFFQLHTIASGDRPHPVPGDGKPRVILALYRRVTLCFAGAHLPLDPGQSCFAPASHGPISATGDGTLFVATTGPTKA